MKKLYIGASFLFDFLRVLENSLNMKMRKSHTYLILLLICILPTIKFYSQRNADEYFPKPPEAVAIGKFIDMPVGNYSGTTTFTIPLFDIDFDGVSVPFNLSYHASGIKVSEISSRVGLGWTLNLGGASLSGQIIGTKDFSGRYIVPNYFDPNVPGSKDQILAMNIVGMGNAPQDVQPDIFTYSTFSNQGEFIMDSNGNFGIPRPFNLNKITAVVGGINIVDEKGFIYKFKEEGTISANTNCSPPDLNQRSSYNLQPKEIESPTGKKITYNHSSSLHVNSKYFTSLVQNKKIEDLKLGRNDSNEYTNLQPMETCYTYNSHNEHLVKNITFPEGQIDLIYNNNQTEPRLDLPGDFYVKQIILRNASNHIIKNFVFNYEYFSSTDNIPTTPISGIAGGTNKRLKLLSIVDSITQSQYKMKYYGDSENMNLPNRMSNSYDYWGVYNGKNNQSSISTTIYKNSRYDTSSIKRLFVGADKQPDFEFGKIGNLKEIIYPTGGSTEITYEADDFVKEPFTGSIYSYEKMFSDVLTTSGNMNNNYMDFSIGKDAYEFELKFYSEDNPQMNFPPKAKIGDCQLKIYKHPDFTNPIKSLPTYFPQNENVNYYNTIEPGIYRLYITSGYNQNLDTKFHCIAYANWYEQTDLGDPDVRKAGTIRIRKIAKTDNNQVKITREYSYKVPTESGTYTQSSGINIGDQYFTSITSSRFPRNSNGGYIERTLLTNNPGWNLSTVGGKAIGYSYVQEEYKNNLTNEAFRKEYAFYNEDNHPNNMEPYSFIKRSYPQKNFMRGFLLNEKTYNSSNEIIRYVENEKPTLDPYFNYLSTASPSSNLLLWGLEIYNKAIICVPPDYCYYEFDYEPFNISNYWLKDVKTTTTQYVNNQPAIITEQTTVYSADSSQNRHTFPQIQTETIVGTNTGSSQHYKYAHDLNNYLKEKNIISIPLETEITTTENGLTKTISKTVRNYPTSEAEARLRIVNNTENKDYPLLFEILSENLQSLNMDKEVNYDSYDPKGNLLQYTLKPKTAGNGTPVAIIFGYNQTKPIAKVEGATYAQISGFITDIVNYSNTDASVGDDVSEQNLISQLDAFRKKPELSSFQITTYSYDPLIGVKSITPPTGIREVYIYDTSNRLKEVKDINHNILKQYEYNYKH